MASPHPQPTALKAARGNPGRRPLPKNEPKPTAELPPPPDWLPPLGRKTWDRLVPELQRLGILTSIDIDSFTRYCQNSAEWHICRQFLAEHGPDLIVKDEEGKVTGVVPYPHTKRKRELELLLLRYETEYGMTPSSRSKLNTAPAPEGDELDALLAAPMRIAK